MPRSKKVAANVDKDNDTMAASHAGRSHKSDDATSTTSRRLVIRPLASVGDRGKPSNSVSKDLRRVMNFVEDERHLVAYELYQNVKPRWEAMIREKRAYDAAQEKDAAKNSNKKGPAWLRKGQKEEKKFDLKEFETAHELVKKHRDDFSLLMKRAPLLLECRDNMDQSEGWTLAQTLFGVSTYYRREEDGSLSLKLEGELKGVPLFEQVAVLREVDLHSYWAPFVSSSLTLGHLNKLDTVGWFIVGLPNFGVARDSCFRALGCDCFAEDESVLLVGRGVADRPPGVEVADPQARFLVEDPVLETLDIPPWPTRMGSGRMTMKRFEAKISVLAPDHCHTYIVANLDPNLSFIPQSLLEFVMKKLCGFLLNKLQGAAKKIPKDPVRNVHAQRMRDESAFYRDWLYPKFQAIAAEKGWEMPGISAFELTESQQMEVEKLNAKRTTKMHSFSEYDAGDSKEKVKVNSSHSEPGPYRTRRKMNKDDDDDDDDSDISSLSGTSQSIWSRNPISSYLREVEARTQERKDQKKAECKRKAAALIRPRPIPVDKQERLRELKMHKREKLKARHWSSSGSSMDTLPPVDETTDGDTVVTGRSVPYSPMTAPMKNQGRWRRFLVVSLAIVFLSVLLHVGKFIEPVFSAFLGDDGNIAIILRDCCVVAYLFLCGVVHFGLCDMLLIYAFEAFELGMKSGEQVKTFYRGHVRIATAGASGLLVVLSIFKAILAATTKAGIAVASSTYSYYMSSEDSLLAEDAVDLTNATAPDLAEHMNSTVGSILPASVIWTTSAIASFGIGFCRTLLRIAYAVFDWEMAVFVRSNFLGRFLESLVTGIYNAWMGLLAGIGNGAATFVGLNDDPSAAAISWREDAMGTLRPLLLYTVVFLWVVLALVNVLAKTYRHPKHDPDAASVAATTTSHDSSYISPVITKVSKVPLDSASKRSKDSSKRRLRLKGKKKKGSMEDDDSM